MLSDDEVAGVQSLCTKLANVYAADFAQRTMTIKLHMLIHHVPEFIQRFRTIGYFSEQAIESSHALVNKIERKCCSVRGDKERLNLVLKSHQLTLAMENREDFDAERRPANEKRK